MSEAPAPFRAAAALPEVTRSKKETVCGLLSTLSANCSAFKPSTKWPFLSKTMTSVWTSSVLTRITSSCSGDGVGLVWACAEATASDAGNPNQSPLEVTNEGLH